MDLKPKCRYCDNEVELDSPRVGERICKACTSLDRIGNQLQVQLGKECLRRLKNENS